MYLSVVSAKPSPTLPCAYVRVHRMCCIQTETFVFITAVLAERRRRGVVTVSKQCFGRLTQRQLRHVNPGRAAERRACVTL